MIGNSGSDSHLLTSVWFLCLPTHSLMSPDQLSWFDRTQPGKTVPPVGKFTSLMSSLLSDGASYVWLLGPGPWGRESNWQKYMPWSGPRGGGHFSEKRGVILKHPYNMCTSCLASILPILKLRRVRPSLPCPSAIATPIFASRMKTVVRKSFYFGGKIGAIRATAVFQGRDLSFNWNTLLSQNFSTL